MVVDKFSSEPSLLDDQVDQLSLFDFHGIFAEDHEICHFVLLDGTYNVIHVALEGSVKSYSADSFFRSQALLFIEDFPSASNNACDGIVDLTDGVNRLAVVI